MNKRLRSIGMVLGAVILGSAGIFVVQHVRAAGIPTKGALTYTGYLEDDKGTPVTTEQMIGLAAYDSSTAGTKVCEVEAKPIAPVGGRFQIQLPDACVAAVSTNPELWVEVSVGAVPLGRTKLGAVPYAVEAGHAVSSDTATNAGSAVGTLAATLAILDSRLKTLESHPKSGFLAWLSVDGTDVPAAKAVPAIFDEEGFDLDNEYDPTTGIFSPKRGGVYLINCGFWNVASGSALLYTASIYRNGIGPQYELSGNDAHSSANNSGHDTETSTFAKLEAGDLIRCALWSTASTKLSAYAHRSRFGAWLLAPSN